MCVSFAVCFLGAVRFWQPQVMASLVEGRKTIYSKKREVFSVFKNVYLLIYNVWGVCVWQSGNNL